MRSYPEAAVEKAMTRQERCTTHHDVIDPYLLAFTPADAAIGLGT